MAGVAAPDTSPEAAWRSPWWMPEPCQRSVTGHCKAGRHERCPYRPGGPCANGIWLAECSVTLPKVSHGHLCAVVVAQVVEPHHIYRCPCKCHHGELEGQLDLFGGLL